MFPDILNIGPLTIHTYGVFVAAGFLAGLMVAIRLGKNIGLSSEQVMDMGFVIIASAIVGSRLMYILINASYYIQKPLEMFMVWKGGLVFSGGLVCVLIVMAWYVRRYELTMWQITDMWAPSAAIGQGLGRIGCFMAGCCYGKPTDSPWNVTFTHPNSLAPLNIPLYPTQLYSSINEFIIFTVIYFLYSRKKFDGQVSLWFLILHSTSRLAIERFRGDDRGIFLSTDITITQLLALCILISSVITLIVLKVRRSSISS